MKSLKGHCICVYKFVKILTFFCFSQQFGPYSNDYIWYIKKKFFQWCNLTLIGKRSKFSGTHIKTILGTQLFFLWSPCRCLQYFLSIYMAEEHKALNPKVVCVKIIFSSWKNANIWPKQKLIGTRGILKHINTQKRTQKKTLDHNFSWPADTSG